MSTTNSAADGVLHRPKPRRPFNIEPLTSTSSGTNTPSSPYPREHSFPSRTPNQELPSWIDQDNSAFSPASPTGLATPGSISMDFSKRTKSLLNLTGSTLFGIYSQTYSNEGMTEPPTPYSTLSRTNSVVNVDDTTTALSNGAASILGNPSSSLIATANGKPSLSPQSSSASSQARQKIKSAAKRRHGEPTPTLKLILRLAALMGFGICYGIIVMHLHNSKKFTPASWGEIVDYNPVYLLVWGLVGVVLGSLLPWIDYFLGDDHDSPEGEGVGGARGTVAGWMQVVRSIGAFVGIAYGIRKLPWQSTLQIALGLSLVNPFLWYIVDRTRAGFWLSAFVGSAGTLVLVQINPDLIPSPETHSQLQYGGRSAASGHGPLGGWVSEETIGASAWMCSVLFCSCVCFGNIGRRLAFRQKDL